MQAAQRNGWDTLAAPLLAIERLDWLLPPRPVHALLLTSARAVAGPLPPEVRALPVYAVGEATADAARTAGLVIRATGTSDGSDALARAAADGHRDILHLRGEAAARLDSPAGVRVHPVVCYRASRMDSLPADAATALQDCAIFAVLLMSARTAAHFAALLDQAGIARAHVRLVVLAASVATAAGPGWNAVAVAERPDAAALLAAADRLWQEAQHG